MLRSIDEAPGVIPLRDIDNFGVPPALKHCSRETWNGEWPTSALEKGELVLIHGPVGCGKSHVAVALAKEAIEAWNIPVGSCERAGTYSPYTGTNYYWQYGALWADVQEAIEQLKPGAGDEDGQAEKSLLRSELLVFDDLGSERMTEWTMDRVSLILRHRYNYGLTTVITTNLRPSVLNEIDPRVASRILSGRVVKLNGADYRLKPEPA